MRTIVVDVDTQHDFIAESGALYVPAPPSVPEAIRSRLEQAVREGDPVIGSVDSHAHDAWEFDANGGPFPAHCVKGTAGWLRVHAEVPSRIRFVPMQVVADDGVRNLVGEATQGEGPRTLDASALASEAIEGVGIFFEKEVYSLFSNPACSPVVAALVERLGGPQAVQFEVIGYCTGGYCVDAAVTGLLACGYTVRVLAAATGAIGGLEGEARSRQTLTAAGASWVEPQ